MDRPKGRKNRYWSKEGKLRIVLVVSMEFNVKSLCKFIKVYRRS